MRLRVKVLTMAAIAMLVNPVFAGFWDWGALPVPENTQEVNRENRRYGGSNFDFIYYQSSRDAEGIRDFYRNHLSAMGWKESEMRNKMQEVPGFDSNPGFSKFFDNNLLFEKGGEILTLCILPEAAAKNGKTRYSLQRGTLDINNLTATDKPMVVELASKPRKEILVYPGASLLQLSEGNGKSRSSYMSTADMETIIAYYKDKMPGRGWTLVEEQPIQKVSVQNNAQEILQKNCPNCTAPETGPVKVDSLSAELKFTNDGQDSFRVALSSVSFPEMSVAGMQNTVIVVSYDDKKK